MNILAWNYIIRLWIYFVGLRSEVMINRFMARANIKKINYRVKTAERSFGEQSVSGDDGDDADLGSDGDLND